MANKITGSKNQIQSIQAEIYLMKGPPTILTVQLCLLEAANEEYLETSSLSGQKRIGL